MRPICLLVHAAPSAAAKYEAALDCPVYRVQSTGSQFSAGYDERKGIALHTPTVADAIRKYAPACDPATPVVLVGFSAGCWALRHWLRHKPSREQTIAAVFVDGLHAGGSDKAAILSERHEGVLAYGELAKSEPDKRALVITHSQIVPPGYASTRATAKAIRAMLGDGLGFEVVSSPGNDAPAHVRQLNEIGPLATQKFVRPLLLELADTLPPGPLPWKDPSLTWGERRVLLAREEMASENPPSNPTLARYFAPCVRDGKNLGAWLASEARKGKRHNHCAATGSWLMLETASGDELDRLPHEPRAGAKECRADAIERGTWRPKSMIADGWRPEPGDTAIYDRSQPGRAETKWWGHYDLVTVAKADGYENIGANEGARGAWRDHQFTRYDHDRLLGFVEFPRGEPTEPPLIPEDVAKEAIAMVALTIADTIAEAPWA